MPSRKSDQRKADVSFNLKSDIQAPSSPSSSSSDPPPTKAAATAIAATSDDKKEKSTKEKDADATTIEDLALPKSIIARLAKGVLPANTQIQANAVLALSKSTTVFISHLASFANDHTIGAGKKTVSPADVFKALEDTEFGFLKERLEAEFAKFNTIQTEKRTSYRNKVKAKTGPTQAEADTSMADTTTMANTTAADTTTASTTVVDDSIMDTSSAAAAGPRAKKARLDVSSTATAAEEHDAETEEDEHIDEDDDDNNNDEDENASEEEEGEETEEEGEGSGDETQDALEEVNGNEEVDEALDGDDSD